MAKTLQDILTAVGAEDAGTIQQAIQAEKDRGIEASRKKGEEVNKHLTELNRLRDFLSKTLEFNLDEDLVAQYEEAQKDAGQNGQKATELEKQVKTLTKQVETLTTQKAESDKVAGERAERLKTTKLTELLRKQLGTKLHAPDYVIKGLIRDGNVKLLDDEETAVFIVSGNEVPLEKGAQDFLKANPGIVKNEQVPGSNSDGSHTAPGDKVIKRAEFEKLSAVERSAKVKEGFKLTD
jgi:hypothetical protein